jgi:transcription initiation factor TFIIB
MSAEQCPECGSTVTDEESETVCADCGLVIDSQNIDRGPDWRAFNHQERDERSRTGGGVTNLVHDRGLGSEMGWEDDPENTRLRKWDRRFKSTSSDQTVRQGIGEIRRMASALDVPKDSQEVACQLIRQLTEDGKMTGQCIETVAGACLYAGCRVTGAVRSFEEISHVSRVDRIKQTMRRYHDIIRENDVPVGVPMPRDYIGRLTTDLDCSQETEMRALEILKKSSDTWKSGKKPTVIAAAAIYIAGLERQEEMTQQEIADAAGIVTVSIRNRYSDMTEWIDTGISRDED